MKKIKDWLKTKNIIAQQFNVMITDGTLATGVMRISDKQKFPLDGFALMGQNVYRISHFFEDCIHIQLTRDNETLTVEINEIECPTFDNIIEYFKGNITQLIRQTYE